MIPESEYPNYMLFFDNFFTSVDTLITLGKSKMKATGTIRETRTNACPLIDSKRMGKEKEQGFYDYMFDKENEVLVLKWSDNKPVCVATNYSTITPLSSTKRYSQAKKKEISVTMPHLTEEYNAHMGGVDLLDKEISLYRTRIRSKKWWCPLFTHMIDICVVNTWRAYQIANSNEKLSLLDVRQEIVKFYLSKKTVSEPKRRGPQGSKLMGGRVNTDLRLDPGNHFIVPSKTQKRCAYCKKKTTKICDRCNVGVHDKCFASFRTE
ncbi:piggyBac transposable element-derived protein 2-like [Schistocerca nitens]|uniref:piggyBac transposable element-derived protein 2-like n=1 Tax=Schistocerca nitens TaxID=7011 RepID=UPI002118FA47|nr:piggyBac transposable element-derived protein 2-like [Schistocerca nitens]